VSGAASASAPARAGGALTVDQLKAALLADADVPGYTVDPGGDSSDVKTEQDKVSSGGTACQKFMDASNGLASYGTVAEADHSWKNDGTATNVQFALFSFPTADQAKKVLADTRSGLAACPALTAGTGNSVGSMTLSPLGDLGVGDSSSAFASVMNINGFTIVMAVAVVQVGSTTFNVAIGGPGLQKSAVAGKTGDLKAFAAKQATKLKAAQNG
jgi:hypothetical protein